MFVVKEPERSDGNQTIGSAHPPMVGIAMATFNPGLAYFLGQIHSLKNQTYTNWKCVVVDDCSSDKNFQVILDVIDSDPRFEVHRNQTNQGSFKTFERALTLLPPDTTLICYCDQDDVWIKTKLETQVREFSDPSIFLVHTDQSLIDEKSRILAPSCWKLEGRSVLEATTDLLLFRNLITGCTAMFRREVLKTALPFCAPRAQKEMYHHDIWVAMHACLYGRVVGLTEPLVLYRQHGGNLVGVSSLRRNVKFGELAEKAHNAFNERLGLREDFLGSFERLRSSCAEDERHWDYSEKRATEKENLSYLDNHFSLFCKGIGFVLVHPLFFRTWIMLGVGLFKHQRTRALIKLKRLFN
ncbi:MAG: glycosyltransferase family 2 protein [Bdellovibrionaceae bacterium]|nr:glycosyltransferase family 2 protein [Pseudobdellovibrionaceae bacterium]